jgi:hypothetical protein
LLIMEKHVVLRKLRVIWLKKCTNISFQWTWENTVLHFFMSSISFSCKVVTLSREGLVFLGLCCWIFVEIFVWEKLQVSIVVHADVGLWFYVKWYSKGSPFWYALFSPLSFPFIDLTTNIYIYIYIYIYIFLVL